MFKELCINDKKKPWHYHVYKKKTKHFYIYFEYPGARLLFSLTYLSI